MLENDEDTLKLTEIIELLVAAGYFRARIKGLSSFDKIVGGIVWCIEVSSYDIDVDLFFQENLSIGQKIILTEKIVEVLNLMQCPHNIEPHQIQGLDFLHVYSVVQWLVKKAIETREQTGNVIRVYAINQFNKKNQMPEDLVFNINQKTILKTITDIKEDYKPKRKYIRQGDAEPLSEERLKVQSTLLEYGRMFDRLMISDKNATDRRSSKVEKKSDELNFEQMNLLDLTLKMSLNLKIKETLSESIVKSVLKMQSEEIKHASLAYAEKHVYLGEVDAKLFSTSAGNLSIESIEKQIQINTEKLNKLRDEIAMLTKEKLTSDAYLNELINANEQLKSEIKKIEEIEKTSIEQEKLEKLNKLIEINENLKKQEKEFRSTCLQEKEKYNEMISMLEKGDISLEENEQIEDEYELTKSKLAKIRILLAKKNREISVLQRKIDSVPSRSELNQYQWRFIELYNQISLKHKETKQFFTLFNSLEETRSYLNKEVNLLNSIHDNFVKAMFSPSQKEQFMKQFEEIVNVVQQNKIRADKRKQEAKLNKSQLQDKLFEVIEQQRLYYKTVKDFQDECKKNEILIQKLQEIKKE